MTAVAIISPRSRLSRRSSTGGAHRRARPVSEWNRPIRLAILVVVVGLAYHYTIFTLLRTLVFDSPLAYLGVVPFLSVGLAVAHWRRAPADADIHDRQLDLLVGVPLVAGAVLANKFLPSHLSTVFWYWRVDVATMPFFVAGMVSLLLGLRTLARVRVAVAYLFLAWPYPFTLAMFRWLDSFTNTTISALSFVMGRFPVAVREPGGDGSLFIVKHGSQLIRMSVASSCSGANSLLGFLLMGSAALTLCTGKRWRKALWILTGSVLVWILNVVRIFIVFAVAGKWGEGVAIDAFHPVIGLVLFSVAMVVMVMVMKRFGLEPKKRTEPSTRRMSTVKGFRLASVGMAVGVIAALAGTMNSSLASFEIIGDDLGQARLTSFSSRPGKLEGFNRPKKIAEFPWARRYFGESSKWSRFIFDPTANDSKSSIGKYWASTGWYADVISNSSIDRFNTFGIEACYRFHGYTLGKQETFDLGGGVVGTVMSWVEPGRKTVWTSVYWHWPVKSGKTTAYERVTLLLPDNGGLKLLTPADSVETSEKVKASETPTVGTPTINGRVDAMYSTKRNFLVGAARELIANQQKAVKA